MRIRRLTPPDRADLERLLTESGTFNEEEIRVALEVIDAALADPGKDYHVLVAEMELEAEARARVVSYVCYGPTPMTEATYDLYWIATHPDARGQGCATRLMRAMEAELPTTHSSTVRIETSQMESYGAARGFYERAGYTEVGRIRDFYKVGDDLIIFARRFEPLVRTDHLGGSEPRQRVALDAV
jgi:ribosomal protein S18 acetylase RimI-like enzyme